MTVRELRATLSAHALVVLVCVFSALPVVWAVSTSFKGPAAIFAPDLVPADPTLDNYRATLATFPVARLVLNTGAVAAAVAALQLLLAVLAAYGLVRFRFRGGPVVLTALAAAIIVPQQCLIVPNYLLAAQMGWIDTYVGLAAPQLAGCALGVLLLHQHVRAFPRSLLDAAQIDGAGHATVLWRIVVPNLRPVLVALAVLFFITSWNEYLWPLLVASGTERATVQVGLQAFQTEQGNDWGRMMAAAVLVTAPVLLAYGLAQRWIVAAFVQGTGR